MLWPIFQQVYIQLNFLSKSFKTVILGTKQSFFSWDCFYWKCLQILFWNLFKDSVVSKNIYWTTSLCQALFWGYHGEQMRNFFTIFDSHISGLNQNRLSPKHVSENFYSLKGKYILHEKTLELSLGNHRIRKSFKAQLQDINRALFVSPPEYKHVRSILYTCLAPEPFIKEHL